MLKVLNKLYNLYNIFVILMHFKYICVYLSALFFHLGTPVKSGDLKLSVKIKIKFNLGKT